MGLMLEKDRLAGGANRDYQNNEHTYNELVIDGTRATDNLPRSVEAFLVGPGDDRGAAQRLHQQFLREHGLSAEAVPLLTYNPRNDGRGDVFQ